MCGLIGFFARPGGEGDRDALGRALERMRPRGPDDEGQWGESGVLLGHRRLAIVDLDHRSAQPMHSSCGRYAIVFNGEIYNYRALRQSMEANGVAFRTTSDTEVILELFARQGESMLDRLQGMFAMTIWDRVSRRAFVARDPYGIKPLYVAQTADGVWVASQVKALLATGRVAREPDPVAQAGFYLLGSVAEPRTWFAGIAAVGSGECLWIDDGRVANRRTWACIGAAWRRANDASPASPDALQADVTAALRESVGRHLVADVPVGVFLSGGVDSGALAGLMLEAGARDLQGVTIAYDEFRGQHEDEAPVAAAIAHRYGIRHHVRRVTRDEFLSDLPRILDAMDQPSIDGVNTWFASKAVAEQGLKVVVSGVGGDELFFGYELFSELPRIVRARQWLARVPGSERPLAALARLQARRTGNLRWSHAADWTKSVEGAWWLRKGLFAPDDLMRLVGEPLTGEWVDRFDARSEVGRIAGPLPGNPKLALAQIESTGYLRNQLLRDSDWASMAHSVELRTPLVDMHLLATLAPRLAELSRVPGKRCLALAPRQPLPDEVIRRRKTGFGIPVARWLREAGYTEPGVGPSQAWARVVAARAYG